MTLPPRRPAARVRLEPLEAREVPATSLLALGTDAGGGPRVTLVDPATGSTLRDFFAYDPSFTGGVRTAVADFTGDGNQDVVTAPGPGINSVLRIFDGQTGSVVREFTAFGQGFTGGASVATADFNRDGVPDVVAGAGAGGGPRVNVLDGKTGAVLADFFAYEPTFLGGVNVAAGDVTGDGRPDIAVGSGVGGGPAVRVFDALSGNVVRSFFAYEDSFRGGVNVALGDLNGDKIADVIAGAGVGGGPRVTTFDGVTSKLLNSFFAYDSSLTGGVRVGSLVTAGELAQILTAPGAGAALEAKLFDAAGGVVRTLSALDGGFLGGGFASAGSLAGQLLSDIGGAVDDVLDGLFEDLGLPGDPLVTLQLKPLDVNLLGLRVTTSPIQVVVSAKAGDGLLLGNVLTAASNLVNLPGASEALNKVLASVVDLLNAGALDVSGLLPGSFGTTPTPGTTTVLDLYVAPVQLDLLGVRVDTSPITVRLEAVAGEGQVLGNILTALTDLFNPPLPERLDLAFVNERLRGLLAELEAQLPGFSAPAGTPTAPPEAGAREVLSLSVPPIDLDLLGLKLTTDEIQVNADAVTGDGKLLGNVLTLLLDTVGATPEQVTELNTTVNAILGKVIGVLNAADLSLVGGAVESLSGVLQTLALPNLLTAEANQTVPVLNLAIASPDASTPPVRVDLLGLLVTTSNIRAQLTATTGEGQVLGNLAYNVANLLNPGGALNVLGILNDLVGE